MSGTVAVLMAIGMYFQSPPDGDVVIERRPDDGIALRNSRVQLVLSRVDGAFREEYFAFARTWHLVLRSGNALRPEPSLRSDGNVLPAAFTEYAVTDSQKLASVQLRARAGNHTITKDITLGPDDTFFRVRVTDQVDGVANLSHLLTTYSFVANGKSAASYGGPEFIWTPQLRPDSDDIIADHTFRSPALMMQQGSIFAALLPAVELIQPWRNVETGADVQVAGSDVPLLSYGAMKWKPRSHVYYTHSDAMTMFLENSRFSYGMDLYVTASAVSHRGFREVVRFLWDRNGRRHIQEAKGPQREPFPSYVHKAWDEYLPSIALDAEYHGVPVTLLRQERLAWSNKLPPEANNDCWFNVWFNALRTAYGAYLYARQADDTLLMSRAERVLNLALLAPQRKGIAPSIFYIDSTGGHWVNDHAWGGINGGRDYAMFHNAWTGVWLLAWSDLLPERRQEILRYTRSFAEFLIANQLPSGVIPSWYDPETLKPIDTLRVNNAETAGAALFLAEFYRRTRERPFLNGAERAMRYVFTEVVPHNKWFDYETFFSCSRKPLTFFDSYTGQFPQNTLSMHQAAEACLVLHELTGKEEYKTNGLSILDYLCLYQQVWSPPWLSRELFGGFGVQNTDGEWSDSRQGYFAVTLVRYAAVTGSREYFERGVAALRAMFSLFESPGSPRTVENYAHSAIDRPGGVTGIHWGTGSSVVSIHLIRQQYGDAFVNIADRWGVGIDGCRISNVVTTEDTIAVTLLDNLAVPREVLLTLGNPLRARYTVIVNNATIGSFSADELRKGITVAL
jgi:hypothetical protein